MLEKNGEGEGGGGGRSRNSKSKLFALQCGLIGQLYSRGKWGESLLWHGCSVICSLRSFSFHLHQLSRHLFWFLPKANFALHVPLLGHTLRIYTVTACGQALHNTWLPDACSEHYGSPVLKNPTRAELFISQRVTQLLFQRWIHPFASSDLWRPREDGVSWCFMLMDDAAIQKRQQPNCGTWTPLALFKTCNEISLKLAANWSGAFSVWWQITSLGLLTLTHWC